MAAGEMRALVRGGSQLELAADYRFDSIVGGNLEAAVSEFGEERA